MLQFYFTIRLLSVYYNGIFFNKDAAESLLRILLLRCDNFGAALVDVGLLKIRKIATKEFTVPAGYLGVWKAN